MRQTGTVREIHDDYMLVGTANKEDCESCSSSFCTAPDETVFEAGNPRGLDVQPGDRVELFLATGKTIGAGFLVLIVPLLLFAAAYLIAAELTPSDGISALAGIAGLAAGFGLSYLVSIKRKRKNLPEIVKVTSPAATPVE